MTEITLTVTHGYQRLQTVTRGFALLTSRLVAIRCWLRLALQGSLVNEERKGCNMRLGIALPKAFSVPLASEPLSLGIEPRERVRERESERERAKGRKSETESKRARE